MVIRSHNPPSMPIHAASYRGKKKCYLIDSYISITQLDNVTPNTLLETFFQMLTAAMDACVHDWEWPQASGDNR